jgi:hypothetical protein
MAFNHTTLCLELCDHFYNLWGSLAAPYGPARDEVIEQNSQRIMEITKWCFMATISSMEFCARQATKSYPAVLSMPARGRQHLWDIITKSRELQLVDRDTARGWNGLLELRNLAVHNNGVADKDMAVRLPNGFNLALRKGAMTKGDLLTFVRLSTWAVEAYAEWCDAFLTRAGIGP